LCNLSPTWILNRYTEERERDKRERDIRERDKRERKRDKRERGGAPSVSQVSFTRTFETFWLFA
jgi:hypothetical protein